MRIVNRSAFHKYQILDKLEAGIKLTGAEVKSVKMGHLSFAGSFVKIIGSEAYLVNCNIGPYPFADNRGYNPTRVRKILLRKKEIIALKTKTSHSALTMVALAVYNKGNLIKAEIGVVKAKKKWDKRAEMKKRAWQREREKEMKLDIRD